MGANSAPLIRGVSLPQKSVRHGRLQMATKQEKAQRKAFTQWIGNQSHNWDLAVCWHLPTSFKTTHHADNAAGFSKGLTHYFNGVDRQVFGAANRLQHIRIPRFLTLEYADGVGWHAHGILASKSTGLTLVQLRCLLERQWFKQLKGYYCGSFAKRLFWAEPNGGLYINYISKSISKMREASGEIDVMNIWLK